jgi:hypothetical protein
LQKSLELGKGTGSPYWFGRTTLFLAMSHWKLGDKDKACTTYDQALEWMAKNQPELEKDQARWKELCSFQDEAAKLGIKDQTPAAEKPKPQAADVDASEIERLIKQLRLWDVGTGRELQRMTGIRKGIHGVAFSPDGRRALIGGAENELQLWDLETAQRMWHFEVHASGNVSNAVFFTDGLQALTGHGSDGTLCLWRLPKPDAASHGSLPQEPVKKKN